jgi:AraC-like DNA-binding protein
LHELIREAGRYYTDFDEGDAVALAVVTLIAQLVPAMEIAPRSTFVPRVEHPLLVAAAAAVHADPAAPVRVERFARAAGVSPRHFSRLFKAETGVSFTTWRALVQVQHALVHLARGASVTRVGMDLGYSSTSAFIEMFKRHTGRTPGQSA